MVYNITMKDSFVDSKIENFRALDYIVADNEECVWFCKQMGINIFFEHRRVKWSCNRVKPNLDEGRKCPYCLECEIGVTKPNIVEFSQSSNVLEAIIFSNNFDYYSIVNEWFNEYYNVTGKTSYHDFLKQCEFDYKSAVVMGSTCHTIQYYNLLGMENDMLGIVDYGDGQPIDQEAFEVEMGGKYHRIN